MYDPSIAPLLDWFAVAGYIAVLAIVTWQVIRRSKKQ
jgi:TRAP-type C4-dicarboxylate transport system permease small subunit